MIEVFKVMKGLTNVDKHQWFDFMTEGRRGTRQTSWIDNEGQVHQKADVMKLPNAHSELRRSYFTCRVVSDWNALPEALKAAESLNSFKNQIDKLIQQRGNN